jgi:nicotinamidase-related amidase
MNQSLQTPAALVVIDCQESFRQRSYWNEAEAQPFFSSAQRAIDACANAGVPIVQIFHQESPQGPFARSSGFVRTLAPLRIAPDVTFYKRQHSAFVGSGLEAWLRNAGIERILVTGIRTEQCCETTTRHGSDLGFQADYITEATLTFAMTYEATGRTFSPAEIRERTELVLAGRFARIRRVDEIVEELGVDERVCASTG